jgi:hypothetical protein
MAVSTDTQAILDAIAALQKTIDTLAKQQIGLTPQVTTVSQNPPRALTPGTKS